MPEGPGRCGSCDGEDLTRVPMVLADGTGVVFVSCGTCEAREWYEDVAGAWCVVPIASVLARSARKR